MVNKAKISINIVTWNSAKDIGECLESINQQQSVSFEIIVIDNASTDKTVEIIKKKFPQVTLLSNTTNLGFARAHNQGIDLAKRNGAEYVLVTNPDIRLNAVYLKTILDFANDHPEGASFGGKLLKLKDLKKNDKSTIIDSLGLRLLPSRQVIEYGAGEVDHGQYDQVEEVFGISGALALYRLAALEEIKLMNEYFDEDFFAYKEDVDLAWRLRLHGQQAWYVPQAVAYHRRAVGAAAKRRHRKQTINQLSYKNHCLTLIKNEQLVNSLRDFIPFIFFELQKLFYLLFFEPKTLAILPHLGRQLPRAWRKRKENFSKSVARPKQIHSWISQSSS